MVDLVPLPPESIRNGLYSVVAGALAGGAPEPPWVAVDDGTTAWEVAASSRSADERARGVVAAAGESALLAAQRLGLGGAMWLPPSSLGALEAFSAAAAAEVAPSCDSAAADLIPADGPIRLIGFADRPFWRAQLGDRELIALLAELVSAVGVRGAVLPWPALLLAAEDEASIVAGWGQVESSRGGRLPALWMRSLAEERARTGVLDAAYGMLVVGEPPLPPTEGAPPSAVHELPHGRRVGWWLREAGEELEDEGWVATPNEVTAERCQWRIDRGEPSGAVVEVLAAEEAAAAEDAVALRVPGWAARGLRPGSPAGLLVTRIAESAARRGLPLWVPGIDAEGLRVVLGLPGVIWVDGPAVPG